MFYEYRQNNSGGGFNHHKGRIGRYVIVEAHSAEEANRRAESIGIYFDGVYEGIDCDCCGDRWVPAYDGDEVPSHYGKPIDVEKGFRYDFGLPSYIHYLNGEVVTIAPR